MSYLNSVTLIGFVGADPEQRRAKGNGSKFTVLSVATQRSWKNAEDEWASKVEWHRFSIFRPRLAEYVLTAIKKGGTSSSRAASSARLTSSRTAKARSRRRRRSRRSRFARTSCASLIAMNPSPRSPRPRRGRIRASLRSDLFGMKAPPAQQKGLLFFSCWSFLSCLSVRAIPDSFLSCTALLLDCRSAPSAFGFACSLSAPRWDSSRWP